MFSYQNGLNEEYFLLLISNGSRTPGRQWILAYVLLSSCGYLDGLWLHLLTANLIQRFPIYRQPACGLLHLMHNQARNGGQRETKKLIQPSQLCHQGEFGTYVLVHDGVFRIFVVFPENYAANDSWSDRLRLIMAVNGKTKAINPTPRWVSTSKLCFDQQMIAITSVLLELPFLLVKYCLHYVTTLFTQHNFPLPGL